MIRAMVVVGLAAALAGCGKAPVVTDVVAPDERAADWHQVATTADERRLRAWRETWLAAVAAARAADPAGVAAGGALFEPDRALETPIPPAGAYRCRTYKLGAKGTAVRGFTAYPMQSCRIEKADGVISFAQQDGPQRPIGLIFADGAARAVFLGTLALGAESGTLEYGRDDRRNMAGVVERIGPARWRIAFPAPTFESQLDVIELVPAG